MNYLNNKEFEATITAYVTSGVEEEKLIEMFDILISNIISGFKFNLEVDDAKQDCFLLVWKKLKSFDPKRGKAFNLFTTIILNHLRLLYSKDKRHLEKIDRLSKKLLDNQRH